MIDIKCRKIIFEISVVIILQTFTPAFLWSGEPGELIKEIILKDSSLDITDKSQERKQKLWENISPFFNFEEMSKRALGKFWRKRAPEEKKEFVELFTKTLKDTYIRKTISCYGGKIVFLKENQDNRYFKVQTKFITRIGKKVSMDFFLLSKHGKWKIYDVIIEGVSLVNNYRSQFNNILLKSSYEELIQKIKQKQSKIHSTN